MSSPMRPHAIHLVQTTWQQLQPLREQAAALFYGRLFELDPALRPLFRGDIQQQGVKLMSALDLVVQGLERLPELLPAVQALARRHAGYGVLPEHYYTVGRALLWTLQEGLGDTATDEVMQAWGAAYTAIAEVMKDAAWPRNAAGPEWQAQAV